MRTFVLLLAAALACMLVVPPAQARPRATEQIPADVKVPNDTVLGVYVPRVASAARLYSSNSDQWLEPGKALDASLHDLLQHLFPSGFVLAPGDTRRFGLLLVVHPMVNVGAGSIAVSVPYRVLDRAGKVLSEGLATGSEDFGEPGAGGNFYPAYEKALAAAFTQLFIRVRPSAASFPADMRLADVAPGGLVAGTRPVSVGTAFFVNGNGQALTAAHLVRGCTVLEVTHGADKVTGRVRASSDLLDLAVIDTGLGGVRAPTVRAAGNVALGESVTHVAFAPQSLVAGSPTLARGTVISLSALAGSDGQYQFSAPMQTGSAGGPVVADTGELVGIAPGTINLRYFIERGLLPQNTNFALGARYVARFLTRSGVPFTAAPANPKADTQATNGLVLASVLEVACFQ